jgi:hypothetical protein
VFRLVSSGNPHLGLTGWGLFDTFSLDVLIDFVYGMLVENADEKERAKIDASLASLDAPRADRMVEVVKHDGTTIKISEKRLAELQANVTNIAHMRARKG